MFQFIIDFGIALAIFIVAPCIFSSLFNYVKEMCNEDFKYRRPAKHTRRISRM